MEYAMSYPYPADPTVIAQRIFDKLDANKATFDTPVQDVFKGDQDRIPRTPAVCIELGDKSRELQGAPDMTLNTYEVLILLYHNKVQDIQDTYEEVNHLAYQIEHLLHQDLQLKNGTSNPYMIQGFVTRHEPGFSNKAGTIYRSARLTWTGTNKTSLPVA